MGSTPKTGQSPAASPAKGKAVATKKPPGRGITKRTGRKPVAAKRGNRGKGRGQKKTYNCDRTQAAYERQRELRELYSTVSMAAKPALDELADRSLKKLIEDPDSHKEVAEYLEVQQQLDAQLEYNIQRFDTELRARTGITDRTYELDHHWSQQKLDDSFDYQTEEFLDGALNRASILDELRREGWPLDTPDLTYDYVENIPNVSFVDTEDRTRKAKPATKRKAEGQPDGQGDPKKLRHTGGLLASEMQPDGMPESNAPSPTPLEEQDTAFAPKKGLPDIPNGATEPDDWGVMSVDRRAKSPANRFIIPQTFQFDDDEIGFRDSTNDSTRKATRASRGILLNQPNSRHFHFDHTVKDYDCRQYKDGVLDPETVEKHQLHPKYGFFLPGSVNEAESPDEHVDGTRPVVVVPDRDTTNHASRSVRAKKMDSMLKEDSIKSTMGSMLMAFCEEEDINQESVTTDEMRDRERQARERLAVPLDDDDDYTEELDHPQPIEVDESVCSGNIDLLLQAAEHQETDEQTPPVSDLRPSRPYDAVRDVFTNTEPAPTTAGQSFEDSTDSLSILADAAEAVSHPPMLDPRLFDSSLPPPNNFLQTALNPTSAFAHIAPAPVAQMEVGQQAPPPRNPFTNHRDSPVLPPLRPNRSDGLGKGPNIPPPQQQPPPPQHRPQEFGSPRGIIQTNSGNFYPPAPPRPFHQGHSWQEPPAMPMPMYPNQIMPGHSMTMMANEPHLSHQMMPYYPILSPPPPHGQSILAPMAGHMEVPAPSVSPPGGLMMIPSPPNGTPRQRGSVSSNGNGSGKYRKIAAAPVPHNRPWPSNGGTELRLAHYDHKEAIKDYRANEPPPRSGPTTIRGWSVNNVSKSRNRGLKKEDSEEKESPHAIPPYFTKWNASEKNRDGYT